MAVLRAPLEEHEKRRTSTPWVPKRSPAPATLVSAWPAIGPPVCDERVAISEKDIFPMTTMPEAARPNCAVKYRREGFRVDHAAVMGRQAAGAGFLTGFIEHGGTDRLVALTGSREQFDDFRSLAGALDGARRPTVWARPLDRRVLRSVGTVFLPDPEMESESWTRRFGSERDYSLCGVTHTIATARAVAALGQYLTAPTQPWDALICTSTAVRGAVERILDHHADYLERRRSRSTGVGWIYSPVRLPVIPLGVDCDRFESGSAGSGSGSRRELRARLRIAEEDVAVLFVGRLSFHAKAHPTPMFLAAQRAAGRVPGRKIHLLLAGQFSNDRIEAEFRAAATQFCGGARAHFLDGSDGPHGPAMGAAWRAADIFVSLSDNVQETFGLTPVEAMAASLPCVVSDWNGYRDTVVGGETGFRIPTVAAPPGAGIDVADRHAAGLDTYDKMIGITSLATAVDVEACAEVVATLARERELRACMGAAGRARARRLYDWRVVVAAYQELWAELAEIRRAGEGVALRNHSTESARVDHPDPFGIYRDHATDLLTGSDTVVVARSGRAARDLAELREGWLHRFAEGAFLPDADVDALMARMATGAVRLDDLVADATAGESKLLRTLLWLRKFDLVEFRSEGARRR